MTGTIQLTPDELASLIASVLEYNGITGDVVLSLYKQGELVDYDMVVVQHPGATLKVRTAPDDPPADMNSIRGMLYPDIVHRDKKRK